MKRPLCFLCLIAVFFLVIKGFYLRNSLDPHNEYDGEYMTFLSGIKDIEYKNNKTVLYLECGVIAYLKDTDTLRIGSRVSVKGKAFSFERATNPGQFDSLLYYNTLGYKLKLYDAEAYVLSDKYYRVRDFLFRLRLKLSDRLSYLLPDTEASVMKTMLLGEKGTDKELKGLYQRNGIAHILSISGVKTLSLKYPLFKKSHKIGIFHGRNKNKYIVKIENPPRCKADCHRQGY